MERNETIRMVERAKAGDKSAFEALYSDNYDRIYRYVLKNTGRPDAAEDITQEVFLQSMQNIGRLEKNGLVERTRSAEDKRVVLIRFSAKGSRQFQKLMGELLRYGGKIFSEMTEEEVQLFFKMIEKAKRVLKEERKKEEPQKKVRKIVIE
jgi:DNA-binding PadR family transcriptional regulator